MTQLLLTATSPSSSANASFNEALGRLERSLASWSPDADSFNALLQQVFGVQPSARPFLRRDAICLCRSH